MTVGENTYDRINDYASVKISAWRDHTIFVAGLLVKSKSLKLLTTERIVRKKMVFSVSVSSVLKRTGNVLVVNTAE